MVGVGIMHRPRQPLWPRTFVVGLVLLAFVCISWALLGWTGIHGRWTQLELFEGPAEPRYSARLVVLVIADGKPVYAMNRAVWSKLGQEHPQVQIYMLVADPSLEERAVVVDEGAETIYVGTNEDPVPGILVKTMRALEVLVQDPRRSFTHVLRTNLSSMWHWERLMAVIDRLSHDGQDYAAGNMNYHESVVPVFLSGSGILMTRGVARLLAEHSEQLRYDIIDDVAIGIFLEAHRVRRKQLERCDFVDNLLPAPLDRNHSCFHYRVKNPADRNLFDGYIFPRLYFELYGYVAPPLHQDVHMSRG